MTNTAQHEKRNSIAMLVGCIVLWAGLFLTSIVAAAMTEKTGDSFVRGINRVYVFFGWQVAAFVVSLISFYLVKHNNASFAKAYRFVGKVPLFTHLLMIAIIVVVLVFTIVTKPTP